MKNLLAKFTTPLVLLLLGLMAGYGLRIRQVNCRLENQPPFSESQVCQQLQQLIGTRILFRDFYQDEQLAQLLFVTDTKEIYDIAELSKSLAGTVDLVLTDRPPVYRLERDGQLQLVTASGSFRENNDQLVVTQIINDQDIYDEAVHSFLAQLLTALGDNSQTVHTIRLISQERFELEINGFPTIIVELKQDPQQVASRLTTVLTELDPAEVDLALQELDLRFELPVLRTYDSSQVDQELIDSQE